MVSMRTYLRILLLQAFRYDDMCKHTYCSKCTASVLPLNTSVENPCIALASVHACTSERRCPRVLWTSRVHTQVQASTILYTSCRACDEEHAHYTKQIITLESVEHPCTTNIILYANKLSESTWAYDNAMTKAHIFRLHPASNKALRFVALLVDYTSICIYCLIRTTHE